MLRPSAAEALYPHLRNDVGPARPPQQRTSLLAQAMYPALTPQAKPRNDWRERDRQSLLRGLRELNAKIDARLAKERSG